MAFVSLGGSRNIRGIIKDDAPYAIGHGIKTGNKYTDKFIKPKNSFVKSAGNLIKNTNTGSGSVGGGYTEPAAYEESAYDRYLARLEQERQNRVNAIKDSIRAKVDQAVRGYEAQKPEIKNNYQNLKNQSEVERYNQARMLRESQANRGALDSGLGRQENLAMQNNYGNALNSINMAEQKDLNEVNRAIQDIRSQGDMQMALAEADMSGDFTTALNFGYENFGNSANYMDAANGIRRATRGGSAVTSSSGTGTPTSSSAITAEILKNRIATARGNQTTNSVKRKLNPDDLKRLRVTGGLPITSQSMY